MAKTLVKTKPRRYPLRSSDSAALRRPHVVPRRVGKLYLLGNDVIAMTARNFATRSSGAM
jgi:hypothetical protein